MIEWLKTTVFPEAVRAQSFGRDVRKFVSFVPNETQVSDQVCSDVVFGDVTVEKENGETLTENVVVKVQSSVDVIHRIFDCDALFHNEILFYTKVLPLLRKYDTDNALITNFPEFVYGKATNGVKPKENVIILKSLHKEGFKLAAERLFLDKNHIDLALKKIAEYHALSLKCKEDNPQAFQRVVSDIKKTKKDADPNLVPEDFLTLCMLRGAGPLKKDPDYKDRLSDFYKHCKRANYWHQQYQEPLSTLNVITHGDFNRNNMMFKYGNDGEPIDVVFFDFAMIKHCSVVIDLSFFFFLNCCPETRRIHGDEFLQSTYYGTLSQQLDGHRAKPSFEDFNLDLRKKGVYGYHLCSFFMGTVVEKKPKDDWENKAKEEVTQCALAEGGQEVTEYLSKIIKYMLNKNYIFDV